MKRLIEALSDMPVVNLKGDRDRIQVRARRAVMAHLCFAIEARRHRGEGPTHGRRLFTKDEAIALGALFFLAMREYGMEDALANSDKLATRLYDRLFDAPASPAAADELTEIDFIEAAEQLSNGIVAELECATGEEW